MSCYLVLNIFYENRHIEVDLSGLEDQTITIGRDITNNIVLDSPAIMGDHLVLEIKGANCHLRDVSGYGFTYKSSKISEITLDAGDVISIGKNVTLLAVRKSRFYDMAEKFDIRNVDAIIIGKRETNDICIASKFVSGEHLRIHRDGRDLILTDLNSKNGVFVNGRKVTDCLLNDGDTINIMGYKIFVHHDYLAVNNVGNGVNVNTLSLYQEETGEKTADLAVSAVATKFAGNRPKYPYYQRSPRFLRPIPSGEVEVSGPPYGSQKPTISWISVLLPPIAMVIISLVMASMMQGAYIYLTLAMTMVTVIVSIANYLSQLRKFKNDEKKRVLSYSEYLKKTRAELEAKRQQHKDILNETHPNISTCIQRVENLDRKLWERTPANEDFLDIRVGRGSEPFRFTVKTPRIEISIEKDPLKNEPEKIVDDFLTVDDVPVSVSLAKEGTVGLIGDRSEMLKIAQGMLVQIATNHAYDEVKIVCIYPEHEAGQWEWMRWLPHVWDDSRQIRFLAKDKQGAHEILESLYETIRMRENLRLSDPKYRDAMQLPYLVFFLADAALVQNEPIMNYLINNNQHLGVSSVFLFNSLEMLPKECNSIIDAHPVRGLLSHRYDSTHKVQFELDDTELGDLDYFARRMAPIRNKELALAMSVPNKVTFLDIFGVTSTEGLNVLERWAKARPYKDLAVPIGKKTAVDNLELDIHEKKHGPHGLVAGTVGSGKSELLQTVILSLAVNFHPHDVTFVIIDYKGGGMANCFVGLPHVIGSISNLSSNEISRALISIKSELKRRQAVFAQHNVNSINDYICLYKEGKAEQPLPHLIIVVDEFAELKADQPEFMRELVSAARLGRSLGIHLILATQKPSGVVDDQIWSNSRFRLCLKVQEAGDSREVLKKPDAANIKVTGRCYLQVGNDEVFEQFQSAWSGAEYDAAKCNRSSEEVALLNLNGSRKKAALEDTQLFSTDKVTQLKAVVDYIADTAKAQKIPMLDGPWLPPLPERLYLEDIRNDGEGWDGDTWQPVDSWVAPVIGLLDDPVNQMQTPLNIDLGRDGHLAIYGAPGTGKTVLLQSIITSLALTHTPNEVNIYALDFGGRTMGLFSELPHLGGVVLPEDEEKLSKLLKLLTKELESRKRSFSDIGVSSMPAYRKAKGENLPAIVVIIDNYSALSELYPDTEDKLVPLSREGSNYGIHLVISANSTNAIRFKVSQNIKLAVALQMADRGDYISIVGRTDGLEPGNVPGRGLIKNNPPLEFQTALPTDAQNEALMAYEMKNLFKAMHAKWQGRRAKPIPVLPDVLPISDLLDNDDVKELVKARQHLIPVGLDTEDLEPVFVDLLDSFCFLVSGQLNSGKTSFLKTFVSLCVNCPPFPQTELYLIDSPQMGLTGLSDAASVRDYITEGQQFTGLMDRLVEELNTRKKDLNEAKRSSQGKVDEGAYIADKYPAKIILIDDLNEFIKMIDDTAKSNFERVVRFAKGLGVYLIITGHTDDIVKLSQIDSLTKAIVDMQTGLALGGSFDMHNFFTVNMPYQERGRSLLFGEGYSVNKGRYKKAKIAIAR